MWVYMPLLASSWLQTQIEKQAINQTFKIPQKPFLDLSQSCKKNLSNIDKSTYVINADEDLKGLNEILKG